MIKHIVAVDSKNGYAKMDENGGLYIPWKINLDKKQYEDKTRGQAVLAGHLTYRQGRDVAFSYVLSEDTGLYIPESEGMKISNVAEAIEHNGSRDLWVIGGLSVYAATLDLDNPAYLADEIYITKVEGDFKCDRRYPDIPERYTCISRSQQFDQNGYKFCYELYTLSA